LTSPPDRLHAIRPSQLRFHAAEPCGLIPGYGLRRN
jgi:hypothetical protein